MESQRPIRKCERCGCLYSEPPAISRKDNTTEICPDCGMREALEDFCNHHTLQGGSHEADV